MPLNISIRPTISRPQAEIYLTKDEDSGDIELRLSHNEDEQQDILLAFISSTEGALYPCYLAGYEKQLLSAGIKKNSKGYLATVGAHDDD